METSRRNSSVSSIATVRTTDTRKHTIAAPCTFIRLIYGDNQQLLLNSYSSCRRLLDHMKQTVGVQPDETIELIDNDGRLKELSAHSDDYATQYLPARSTYYVLKVEADSVTNEKRYTPYFNIDQLDQRVNTILTNALNALNKSTSKPKRTTGMSRQNLTSQSSSTSTTQSKTKRTTNRK